MSKRVVLILLAVATNGALATAQSRSPQSAPTTKPAETAAVAVKPAPEPAPLPLNVKVEVVITDQTGPGEAAKKTVTMIVGDRQNNSIRSSAQIRIPGSSPRSVGINVDARPIINPKEPNKVLLSFGLDYQPRTGGAGGGETPEPNTSSLTQRLALNLDSGKTVVVSQSADPASDRKITVEVTATILK